MRILSLEIEADGEGLDLRKDGRAGITGLGGGVPHAVRERRDHLQRLRLMVARLRLLKAQHIGSEPFQVGVKALAGDGAQAVHIPRVQGDKRHEAAANATASR